MFFADSVPLYDLEDVPIFCILSGLIWITFAGQMCLVTNLDAENLMPFNAVWVTKFGLTSSVEV